MLLKKAILTLISKVKKKTFQHFLWQQITVEAYNEETARLLLFVINKHTSGAFQNQKIKNCSVFTLSPEKRVRDYAMLPNLP